MTDLDQPGPPQLALPGGVETEEELTTSGHPEDLAAAASGPGDLHLGATQVHHLGGRRTAIRYPTSRGKLLVHKDELF